MLSNSFDVAIVYDAGPTGCGELIINLFMKMKKLNSGQIIKVVSYDLGAKEDIPAWCRMQGHRLFDRVDKGNISHYYIQKK